MGSGERDHDGRGGRPQTHFLLRAHQDHTIYTAGIYKNYLRTRKNDCSQFSSVAQSCPALCNSMDYSMPGLSVHGIFQARIPKWVAISFPGDLPDPSIKPMSLTSPQWQRDSLLLSCQGSHDTVTVDTRYPTFVRTHRTT